MKHPRRTTILRSAGQVRLSCEIQKALAESEACIVSVLVYLTISSTYAFIKHTLIK